MKFLMNEKFTWNPIWEVWMMLVGIVENFIGTTLEDRLGINVASLPG